MPCIVYHTDAKTGNTYAYESVSFRDPETKKVKTKKTYLGRVDPVSGQLIPKATHGKRNRQLSTKHLEQISSDTKAHIESLSQQVEELQRTVADLTVQLKTDEEFIQTVLKASKNYQEKLH